MPTVTFDRCQQKIEVETGTMLIDAIRKAGLSIDAPCAGHGTCGKCGALILTGRDTGDKLSCQFPVTEDILVRLTDFREGGRILESGASVSSGISSNSDFVNFFSENHSPMPAVPVIRECAVSVPRSTLEDVASECSLVKRALGVQVQIPLPVASTLRRTLQSMDYRGRFVLCLDRLLAIQKEPAPCYVLAFDIGTTTIVSYLLNASTLQEAAVSSMLNPQASYGADVISRCEYAVSHQEKTLTKLIRSALCSLAEETTKKAGISMEDIYFALAAGNTCMQHLYLGISPDSLIQAPYTATVDELQLLPANSLGLPIHPLAQAAVLPSIAGFVGGDTVAVLLSLPEDTFSRLTLILDIGTNGEMVLGKGDIRYTCSTAAGPALEGARITCGMRGAAGAVDHVFLSEDGNELSISTIGSLPPIGICGSGLIDLIRCLLDLKILSPRGHFKKPETWPRETADRYSRRLIKKDGITAFLLTDDEDGIFLTQKDIREVQLAKSAIAVGIELLCNRMGVSPDDIETVLLAGAFGNYMTPESACRIGLIPPSLSDRIFGIGNAAGTGAKLAALDRTLLEKSRLLARNTRFVELAASKEFQAAYISHLNF